MDSLIILSVYIYLLHKRHAPVKVFVRIVSVPDPLNTRKPKRYIVHITGKTTLEFIGIWFVERIPLLSLASSTQHDMNC